MSVRFWQEVKKCEACAGTGIYNSYTDYGDEPCSTCRGKKFVPVGDPKPDAVVWALLDAVPTPEVPK